MIFKIKKVLVLSLYNKKTLYVTILEEIFIKENFLSYYIKFILILNNFSEILVVLFFLFNAYNRKTRRGKV